MSPLMYGVVSRHDPSNVHRGSCCLVLPLLLLIPSWISLSLRQDVTFGLGVYSCMQLLWYMTEKMRWWGWAPGNLFKITCLRAMALPCEYEWRSEINANAFSSSLDFSLTRSVIYSHFVQRAHNPCSFSVRPGKCGVRVATDEYDCPLCLPGCLGARKSYLFVVQFGMVRVSL